MDESSLPHTERIEERLRKGERAEARRQHNERVASELDRAKNGATINLSDLMAGKEALVRDAMDES